MTTRKEHWEKVYQTKTSREVSWTQELPKTSLDFVHSFHLPKSASIIDVGGGDSKLVDYLLDEGYVHISVLDISAKAIEKAKQRLGEKANQVTWIVSDITEFHPEESYDCWHDRATFHFLTGADEVNSYLITARKAILPGGGMIIGTFSDKGPKTCSMLDVHQYTEEELKNELSNGFEKIKCITEDHITPFNTTQNFLFCSFRRKSRND
ncbi:MAG: class I SAM-dependent methyltransferase [Bacteroidetes bacterium]|nr:class I SAM-dependent methyltransferase [Bacteroidota bacterium]